MKVLSVSRVAGAIALAGAMGVAALAFADDTDVIKGRRALMKANGEGAKLIGAMLKGESPFDAAAAGAALKNMVAAGHGFGADFSMHFTDGSKSGDTKASPDIWANADDFTKKAKTYEADASAALAAVATGGDAFNAAAGKMFGNCKGCHEKYKLQ